MGVPMVAGPGQTDGGMFEDDIDSLFDGSDDYDDDSDDRDSGGDDD